MLRPQENQADQGVTAGLRLDERIYQELIARIQRGDYELGGKLSTEQELSKEFGVSRPVIRVVLARLRDAGLIVSKRGSGSYISSGTPSDASGYSALTSISDISDYYAFRITLETRSATLAAEHGTPEQIEALQEALAGMDAEIEAGLPTIQRDIRFHALIAEVAGNRYIIESLQMLRPHTLFVGRFVRSLSPSGYVRGKLGMRTEHRQIVEAIARGDAQAASESMREHIRESHKRVFKGE